MLGTLKQALANRAPGPVTLGLWSLRRRLAPSEAQRFQKRIYAALGEPRTVLRGPFRGMHYVRQCYGGSTLNRALAVYEQELHPWIERIIAADPDVVVDIGTSDGYYLVGLASRLPRARLVGFDSVPLCRAITAKVAKLNGVQRRVTLGGMCTASDVKRAIAQAKKPAVICDIDSGEMQVMDPATVPDLARAIILIEVHDNIRPEISAEMRRRFAPTHRITEIPSLPRRPEDMPSEFAIAPADAIPIMDEFRPKGNFWLFLWPHALEQEMPEVVVKTASIPDRLAPASR